MPISTGVFVCFAISTLSNGSPTLLIVHETLVKLTGVCTERLRRYGIIITAGVMETNTFFLIDVLDGTTMVLDGAHSEKAGQ